MQTRHKQIDFWDIHAGDSQLQSKERTNKSSKRNTKKITKKKEKANEPTTLEQVNSTSSSTSNALLIEDCSSFLNQKQDPSEKEQAAILASFLKVCGGFLLVTASNATYYHAECTDKGITPVRHLQLSRSKKKKEIEFSSPSSLIPIEMNETSPISCNVDESKVIGGVSTQLDSSKPSIMESTSQDINLTIDNSKITGIHFPSNDTSNPVSTCPFFQIDPIEMATFPFQHNSTNDSIHFSEKKTKYNRHEIAWKAITPKEILSYAAILLIEALKKSSNELILPSTKEFLSRDRCSQIRYSLSFPEINTSYDNRIDEYLHASEEFSTSLCDSSPVSENEIFSAYLTEYLQPLSAQQLLDIMLEMHVSLDDEGLLLFKSIRKSLRLFDTVVLFLVLLSCQFAKSSSYQDNKEFSFIKYCTYLVQSIKWFLSTPLQQILLPEIHFLEEYKQCKSGFLRKKCFACTVHKRTKYICAKCNKSFCFSEECFVQYHQQNGLPFCRFL